MKLASVKAYDEGCGRDQVVSVVLTWTPGASDVEYVGVSVAMLMDIMGHSPILVPV